MIWHNIKVVRDIVLLLMTSIQTKQFVFVAKQWIEQITGWLCNIGRRGPRQQQFSDNLSCKRKSMAIVGNSFHPLAIIMLPDSTPPPLPWAAWNSYQTHLGCCARWPCNIGRRGLQQQQFSDNVTLLKKSMAIVGNSLHPLAIILLSNLIPPLPWAAWNWNSYQTHLGCWTGWPCNMGLKFHQEVHK